MQNPISNPTDSHRRLRSARLTTVQSSLRELFTGTSGPRDGDSQREGPKTPGIVVQPARTDSSHGSSSTPPRDALGPPMSPVSPLSPNFSPLPPTSTRPITPESSTRTSQVPTIPPQAHTEPQQPWGTDPDVQQPASVEGRNRRPRQPRAKWKAKSPMWFPNIKEPAIRLKLTCCCVSGCLLALTLSLYLGLALSSRNLGQEFHILFILVILALTIYFCHCLIRLCMLAMNASWDPRARIRSPQGPSHIANPREPIRVTLARDEEVAGLEPETTLNPPPAYGHWRYTVRVDPNLLYWQRNDAQRETSVEDPRNRPGTANRPPSYISEDGVSYVISAAPRTLSTQHHSPLPPHPSEAGRLEWNP